MRANSPVDNDFGVLNNPTQDEASPIQRLTKEDLEIAKIGRSPDWAIIKKYIGLRVEEYKDGLFGEDLSGKGADVIGNRFLAAQSVIKEFEALISKIELTTHAVVEAAKQENEES